jgi:hypothetical protein
MKFVSDYTALFRGNGEAYDRAVADVREEAVRRAPKGATGKFADSFKALRLPSATNVFDSVVGSSMSSARVKEKGGYIQARKHDTLFIPAGDGSVRRPVAVRIRPQPTVVPAGAMFPKFMAARLREVRR